MSKSFVENRINCTCEYNFDVIANWDLTLDADYNPYPITDEDSFKTWLESGQDPNFLGQNDLINIVITGFKINEGRIRCNLTADGSLLNISGIEAKNIFKVGDLYNLQTLNLTNNQIVNFDPSIALPSSLTEINLDGNQIVTFDPSIALPSSLIALNLTDNQIVTFDPSIALPSSLITLVLQQNQIVTFDPSIALPSSLIALYLDNNQIVTFDPSIALPSSLEILGLTGNDIVVFNPSILLPNSINLVSLLGNKMTTAGYIASEPWANNIHNAMLGDEIRFTGNVNSVSGTNLQLILTGKGWTVVT